jgi:acetyl/propionyl-CoA carboxylase alpha subunit
VAVGDTVGLIEVMKSLTPVVTEQAGVLFQVENEDAAMAGSRCTTLRCEPRRWRFPRFSSSRREIAVRVIRAARDWASGPCKR